MTIGNLICHVFNISSISYFSITPMTMTYFNKCIAYMYSEHKMSDLPSNCQTWIEQLTLDDMVMMSAVY